MNHQREILLVTAREFRERVLSPAFLLSTFLVPLGLVLSMFLPQKLMNRSPEIKDVVVVSAAGMEVGEAVRTRLEKSQEEGGGFQATVILGELEPQESALKEKVLAGELDGYLFLPGDILASGKATYRAKNVSNFIDMTVVDRAITDAIRLQRLTGAGVPEAQREAMLARVELTSSRVVKDGDEGGGTEATFFLGYFVSFTLYMLIVLYGNAVMLSVLEEKSSRIVEVLLSSLEATHLMAGKILGIGGAALLQVGLWTMATVAVLLQPALLLIALSLPGDALSQLYVPWLLLPVFLLYLLLGFLLYAAVYAAIGSAFNQQQDAQQAAMVPTLILVVPILTVPAVAGNPDSPLAVALSLIPFTSPLVMPARVGAGDVSEWQLLLSLALLGAAVWGVTVLAGRIYRVGVLATGSRPTLVDLLRWARRG